jgi:nucleoredoxin
MKMFRVAAIAATFVFAHASSADEKFVETVKPHLVQLDGNALKKWEPAPLEKAKFIAIYYSAKWCGPCRAFSPELVKFYNEVKPQHPEFELIFVSRDNSEQEMRQYMSEDAMPWPSVRFAETKNKVAGRYAGPGIPCLVLIDASGKVLSHSFQGEQYLGPQKVMADIRSVLKGS